MSSIVDAFLEFLDFIDNIVKWVCIILTGVMFAVVMLQVFARLLPVPKPPWTEELARYLMIYISFIGASTGIKKWNNINVDFFIGKLPKSFQKAISVLIKLAVLVLIIAIGILGYRVFPTVGRRQFSATLNIPMLIPQLSIIIGCVLMTLQLIGVLIREFYTKGGEQND